MHGGDGNVDQEMMVFEHGVDIHQKGLPKVAGNRLQIGSVVGADPCWSRMDLTRFLSKRLL